MRIVFLGACVALLACAKPREQSPPAAADWATQMVDVANNGHCEDVFGFLNKHQELRARRIWYEVHTSATISCLQKTRDRAYAERALPILAEGQQSFPHSSNIVLHRALMLAALDRLDDSISTYKEAKGVATRALGSGGTEEDKEEARYTLKTVDANIKATEALRNARRKTQPRIQ